MRYLLPLLLLLAPAAAEAQSNPLCPMTIHISDGGIAGSWGCDGSINVMKTPPNPTLRAVSGFGAVLDQGLFVDGGSTFAHGVTASTVDAGFVLTQGLAVTANADFGGKRLNSVGNGTATTDAAALGQVEESWGGFYNGYTPGYVATWVAPASGATVERMTFTNTLSGTGTGTANWSIVDHTASDTILCTQSLTCDGTVTPSFGTMACTATLPAGHTIYLSHGATSCTQNTASWNVLVQVSL